MKGFLIESLFDHVGEEHICSIPIEDFADMEELIEFVEKANKKGIAVNLKNERSNFHQGVLVQIYDIKNCKVIKYLN